MWSPDDIQGELEWISQYGRSHIFGLPVRDCPHEWTEDYEDCLNGHCTHGLLRVDYGWSCWCTESNNAVSWKAAFLALETHMWRGWHK